MNINRYKVSRSAIALLSIGVMGGSIAASGIAEARTKPSLVAQNQVPGVCSFITGQNVNIRSGPDAKQRVVAVLNRGDGVRAVTKKGRWVQISAKETSPPGSLKPTFQRLDGWVLNTFINGCSEDKFDMWRR